MQAPVSTAAAEMIAWAENELRSVSDAARLEAELLLADSAGINRAAVMAYPERRLSAEQARRLAAVVARRSGGEPLAYITGQKEFYSLPLKVDTNVLVPRPETELLVEAALERLPGPGARVLDLGTGSGAIALAIKHQRPDCKLTATDRSAGALAVARQNALTLGLEVNFMQSDWFAELAGQAFDLIVSNPPYVECADPALSANLAHEPRAALDGGADGLDAIRIILATAGQFLTDDGKLLLEHGFDQRDRLVALAVAAGWSLDAAVDDLAGQPRVMILSGGRHG